MKPSALRKNIIKIIKYALPLILTFFMISSLMPCFPSPSQETYSSPIAFTEFLTGRALSCMEAYDIPGCSFALVENAKTVWVKAIGSADRETGRAMTSDTPCRVESISKSLTAWGVMKLVQDGHIELDAPLNTYLKSWQIPDSPYDENAITIRTLLTQTSGMPLGTIGVLYDPAGPVPSLREQLTQDAFLFQAPGTSFFYSNTGYNLLELLIEEVSGQTFSDYMRREVLDPLGMRTASFEWRDTYTREMPNGYDNDGHAIPPYVYPDKASGGLIATAADIAAFARAGMSRYNDNPVLNNEMISEIYSIQTSITGFYSLAFSGYGFGHFIESLNDSLTAVSHGGQGSGWMTHFHSVPETGDAIIMLTNSQNSWPFFAQILKDWSQWRGYSAPGMTKIISGSKVMWGLIGLLVYASLLMLWTLAADLISMQRHFAPFAGHRRLGRTFLFIFSLAIGTVLLWIAAMPYFFLSSIFPVAAGWLGISLAGLSGMLLCFALFPQKPKPSADVID